MTDRFSKLAREALDRGVRLTRARRLVLEALWRAGGPRSAADLDRLLRRRVPLSSLYRTLAGLEGAGLLDRYVDATGVARYELAEGLTEHHHHLTCVRCGTTEDVSLGQELERRIAEIASAAGEDRAFRVDGHRLDLEGRCARCS